MKKFILITCLSVFINLSWSQCDGFVLIVVSQNPTCHDFTDGSITISTSGGTAPIIYSVTDSAGTELLGGIGGTGNCLGASCYYIEVIDADGCVLMDSICLTNPDPITVDLSITDPTYPGACDGIVKADTVYGYQGAFESIGYYWTIPGAATVSEVTDVCAGEYSLTINDEFGCSGTFDFALGSLAEIPANANKEIKVFLNRSSGELIVQNPNGNTLNIKVLNLAGQVVFDSEITVDYAIYSPILNKGIYLYSISDNKKNIQTGKLAF